MKIKFKLRTTILMLGQVVFFIVLVSCGGSGGLKAQTQPCSSIDLDVSDHYIDIDRYFFFSRSFTSIYGYYDNGANTVVNFSKIQCDTIKFTEIIDVIDKSKIGDTDKNKKIYGFRVLYGLDIRNNKIKLYYIPDNTGESSNIQNNEYAFEFYNGLNHLGICLQRGIKIYEADNGKLVDISRDNQKKQLAEKHWSDYKDFMRFERISNQYNGREYDRSIDAVSVFFPDDEITAIQKANIGNTNLFIVCGNNVNVDRSNSQTIFLGTIMPRIDSLLKSVTPDEVAAFVGRAGNLGQLCPQKCGELITTKNDCVFKIIYNK